MRAETVAEILTDFVEDFESLEILSLFEVVSVSLQNLAGSPASSHQQAVREAKDNLVNALKRSGFNNIPTGASVYISEMEIDSYLPKELVKRINQSFTGNEITPALTSEKFDKIKQDANYFVRTAKNFVESARFFEIIPDSPSGDEFEFSITVPRIVVNNELDDFGKELVRIDKMMGVFSELATGSREDFKIKFISSSELTVVLESAPAVAVMIATTLERICVAYERVLNIIKLHRELKGAKVPDLILEQMKSHISDTLKKELDEAARLIESNLTRKIETNRRNELKTELRRTLNEIASRFDSGYVFDIRGGTPHADNDSQADEEGSSAGGGARQVVAEKREHLRHFKAQPEPILGLPKPGNDEE